MYKKHQVVLVATKEKSNISLGNSGKGLIYHNDLTPDYDKRTYQYLYILSEEKIEVGDWYYCSDDSFGGLGQHTNQSHRCSNCKKIIASTNILRTKEHQVAKYTTSELLPQIPQSFIEYFITEFNKGNVIDKVNVEYEEYPVDNKGDEIIFSQPANLGGSEDRRNNINTFDKKELTDNINFIKAYDKIRLKINQDNTVNIKPIKEYWSRDEVIAYGKLAFEVGRNYQLTGENNISEIEQNL